MKKIKMNYSDLRHMIKEAINDRRQKNREIKYFDTEGRSLPNGCTYQKGMFIAECKLNEERFILNEDIHPKQYGLSKYRGGIIVFATSVNAVQLDSNVLLNKIKQSIESAKNVLFKDKKLFNIIGKFNKYNGDEERIGAYSIGNAFKGKYVDDNGELFNDKSYTIEVNGLSSKGLMRLAEYIARVFRQETVLVKDLNLNKIFLANGHRSANYDYGSINTETNEE